ncbi:hypothetical protein DFH06DRAFT_69657 [Mycena polygramma]|nr:hypothetical protein DFH06DRAFT_69657 [Mycena polygramma]
MFDKVKTSAVTWIKFVHDLWRKADHILRVDLLLDLTDEALDLPSLRKSLEDDAQDLSDGYGFAPRDGGTLDRIMKVLFNHAPFMEKFWRDEDFSDDAMHSFCSSVNSLKELLFVIIHLTSGGPKRITELLLHKLFNTRGRPRNLRMMLDRFFLLGDYSKTSANSGKDKATLHLIAPALEPLLVRLCLVVLPLERYFLLLTGTKVEPNAHSYLFSSLGQRWGPKRGRKLMLTLTKQFFGQEFGVSKVRHILPAIIDHYELNVLHHPSRGATVARQMGHSIGVAHRLYANPEGLPNNITSALVMDTTEFCAVFHAFMGLASAAGPTEVTADSLRKFVHLDNEMIVDAFSEKVDKAMAETQKLLLHRCDSLEHQNRALQVQVQQLATTVSGQFRPLGGERQREGVPSQTANMPSAGPSEKQRSATLTTALASRRVSAASSESVRHLHSDKKPAFPGQSTSVRQANPRTGPGRIDKPTPTGLAAKQSPSATETSKSVSVPQVSGESDARLTQHWQASQTEFRRDDGEPRRPGTPPKQTRKRGLPPSTPEKKVAHNQGAPGPHTRLDTHVPGSENAGKPPKRHKAEVSTTFAVG